ncbi:MAG: hypothetical protein A2091_04205 [Desulfuromonadales bacterium GWD2_61_12]|nr:MAG: hypothetical protein A2091_04205 [Desulfuromonadales bacterium GWD2_61_12]
MDQTRTGNVESNPQLEGIIRQRIAAEGGISFAEYMELCLYHAEYGYYTKARQRIGKSGDFFTSASVHEAFGRLVARQLAEMWENLGQGPFIIAEQGGGEGDLCLDILRAAAEESPDFFRSLQYRMIEISPDNKKRQKSRLAKYRDKVQWCNLSALAGMQGCFLSNELVDAFPVELAVFQRGHWQQVFVSERDGVFVEELRPAATNEIALHFEWLGVEPTTGNRIEVNLAARRWMHQVGKLLSRGYVLTIDYGYPAVELYAPWRRDGTLMCYHKHTANENPYSMPGCQDLTSHVDFTALQIAGDEVGLKRLFFGEQYRFLMGLGFVDALLLLQSRATDEKSALALRLTLKNLIMPEEGMGGTFKVLVQGKDVPASALLCSRRIADIPVAREIY